MSEPRLLLRVELTDKNKIKTTLGTGQVALLSLALQSADLAVKEQIIMQHDDMAEKEKSPIIQNSEVKESLITNL